MQQPQESRSAKGLGEAIERLPPLTREIFLDRLVRNLSYREIAELTGLSPRKIERHMAKALHRLSKELDGRPLHWWERLLGW